MKRVDTLKILIGGNLDGVFIQIGIGRWKVEDLVGIYEWLDEDLPEAASTSSQPGKAVAVDIKDLSEDPEPKKERKGGRVSRVDTGKIVALRKAGWTLEQIAEEINVDKSTVYYHLAKLKEEGRI